MSIEYRTGPHTVYDIQNPLFFCVGYELSLTFIKGEIAQHARE
jgi:hypothetical protein